MENQNANFFLTSSLTIVFFFSSCHENFWPLRSFFFLLATNFVNISCSLCFLKINGGNHYLGFLVKFLILTTDLNLFLHAKKKLMSRLSCQKTPQDMQKKWKHDFTHFPPNNALRYCRVSLQRNRAVSFLFPCWMLGPDLFILGLLQILRWIWRYFII